MKVKSLGDGVYFLSSDTTVVHVPNKEIYEEYENKDFDNPIFYWGLTKKTYLLDYLKENDLFQDCEEIFIGRAYECDGFFIMDKEPVELIFRQNWIGSGFNYGSCNLVTVDNPGKILILAQND